VLETPARGSQRDEERGHARPDPLELSHCFLHGPRYCLGACLRAGNRSDLGQRAIQVLCVGTNVAHQPGKRMPSDGEILSFNPTRRRRRRNSHLPSRLSAHRPEK